MPDFSVRSTLPEKMDQPGVAEHETQQALRELEVINELLGGYNVVIGALKKIKWPKETVTIMDLGCGGGDMLRAVAKWASKENKKVELVGVDWNPVMTQYAKERSLGWQNISFRTLSIFDDRLMEQKADITMCSLFCHHFEDDELITLVKRMYVLAGSTVIINDLHRHWFAYYSIKALTRMFSKTYLVRYDGPLSVARALTRTEWEDILQRSDISNYSLKWRWAWRWEIVIEK